MTPAEYIESGILEIYASGAATPAEQQEVERMAAAYPEVRAALDQLLGDMERYATLHAVEPDPALKAKILGGIHGVSGNGVAKGKIRDLAVEAPSRWKSFAVAASVVLLLSVGVNVYQLTQIRRIDRAYDQLAERQVRLAKNTERLTRENNDRQQKLEATQHELAFLRNPMTQSVVLNTMVEGHPMKAMVHWNMASKEVAVDPMTLPATTPEQKYVLWAIVDGKPVNEGGFSVSDTTGIMMMETVASADAFAISLEANESVAAPAGPIYVMGKPAQP